MAKISVISPVFNNEKTLEETIQSVINQSFTDWEHIFLDDGSTDKSESIIKRYSTEDCRIKYFKRGREPKGGSVCRNIGVQHASGEYIMFLDSDDLLLPDCLKNRLSEIENMDLDFVVHPMGSFNDGSKDWIAPQLIYTRTPLYLFASSIAAWQITSTLFKRSFFLDLNGFDESYNRLQDVEFHLRALCESKGRYKVFPSSVDCLYRLSPKGYSASKLMATLPMYSKFMGLVENKVTEGVLNDNKKLTRSILLIYSNISLILHSLKKLQYAVSEPIYQSRILRNHVSYFLRWIPAFLTYNGGRTLTEIQFIMAYVISKYAKSYLLK